MPELVVRPFKESDLNLILTTWLKGAYYGSWMRDIDRDVFFKLYPNVVQDILARCRLNVRIACYSDAEDVVAGWVCLEPENGLLHFAYVKPEARKSGVLNLLLTGVTITTCTHLTKPGKAIMLKKGWKFNPFMA